MAIVSEQHDTNKINWVNGVSDPGEMISCGYLPQARRMQGEADGAYAKRIQYIIDALPAAERNKIMGAGRTAALRRASLDANNGRVAMYAAGKPPWHGLGVLVDEAATSKEVIDLAGLNWTVLQAALMALPGDPQPNGTDFHQPFDVPDRVANYRSDTGAYLATVGNGYTPVQNADSFEFMDDLVGAGEARYETAGSIYGGRKIWLLAKLPREITAGKGDVTHSYMLLVNSHDGSKAFSVYPSTVRVECCNTLNIAERTHKGAKEVSFHIRHTGSVKGKVAEARAALHLIDQRLGLFQEEVNALAARSMKGTEIDGFYQQFFPTAVKPQVQETGLLDRMLADANNKGEFIRELLAGHFAETEREARRNAKILDQIMENHVGSSARGTAWGAYNSVSQFVDHQRGSRGRDDEARASNRLESVWFGSGNQLKQEVYAAALQLTK